MKDYFDEYHEALKRLQKLENLNSQLFKDLSEYRFKYERMEKLVERINGRNDIQSVYADIVWYQQVSL